MIWEFVDLLGRRLILWGIASVGAAIGLLVAGDAFWRGLGLQLTIWGAIGGAIGAGARRLADRGRRRTAGDADAQAREAGRIRRILWVNAVLDVAYVAGGVALASVIADGDAFTTGNGMGVIVQGGFLLAFDAVHARWVPSTGPVLPVAGALFEGPEHEPFRLSRVPAGPASAAGASGTAPRGVALLIHGFGGSPAEMRPLATILAAHGWVVEAPLLPGFGPTIRELPDRRLDDWVATVEASAAALRALARGPLVVVGHSMGGSLALVTAERLRPDGIALLAPLHWPEAWWMPPLGPIVRAFLPTGVRPFRGLDLSSPDTRRGIEAFLPGIDLDAAGVREALRDLTVPISLLEQLFVVSRQASRSTTGVRQPVLVVQGLRDEVVKPERTRALLAGLPRQPTLVEVDAGHDLLTGRSPAQAEVAGAVLAFAERIATG